MSDSVLAELERRVRQGALADDPAQRQVASRLDRLAHELKGYAARPASAGWRKLLAGNDQRKAPRGLYIHGGVGRGKTMLMDLFHAKTSVRLKQRAHFHAFMRDVHARIHGIRQQQRTGHVWEDADPIAMVAEQIASEAHLLCFDEFQVTDIADAMILGRLFEAFLRNGIVVVATSNTRPADLYLGGLNRDAFLPFIALIEARFDILGIDDGRDYRRDRLRGERVYITPSGESARQEIDRFWKALTDSECGAPATLAVAGRTIAVPQALKGVARFDFSDLCSKPLGAGDYLAVAEAFRTVILENVPKLSRERHNEARRFMTLIDTLYDGAVRLILSAEAAPEDIYPEGQGDAAFRRAVSRLNEMQSADYWERSARSHR
ncbi:MAG: cell division protein ZapE [Parvibaculaceae bacterium]